MKLIRYIRAWRHIPRGYYCYSWKEGKHKYCPYHSIDRTREYQENGYCSYLGMGDWEIGQDDDFTRTTIIRNPQGKEVGEEVITVKGRDMPFGISLLWDSCKECGIKM